MPLCSTEEAIAEIRQGKMIILVDDEDRENEGDLTMAAEFVTPEAINFMAKFGRGLICLPMSGEMADKLQLPLMAWTRCGRCAWIWHRRLTRAMPSAMSLGTVMQWTPAPRICC